MKRVYERPAFLIETFVANQVVAAVCSNKNINLDYTKCFIGNNVDTENVMMDSSCGSIVKYCEGATSANHPFGTAGMVTNGEYEAPDGALGLIVWCADFSGNKNTAAWTHSGNTVTHAAYADLSSDVVHGSNNDSGFNPKFGGEDKPGGGYSFHCHVAPVFSEAVGLS